MAINTEFARLFKKYRLRSEIETLRQFADLMAAEGVVYDTTIYTRWQKGERVPHQRFAVMKMLEIFTKRGGIKNTMEANALLESLQLRDMSEDEKIKFQNLIGYTDNAVLPKDTNVFVGRDEIMKDVCWALMNRKRVVLHGVPGIGKTMLAIHIGHFLKDRYSDGVLWFRVDDYSDENLVNHILTSLNLKTAVDKPLDQKKILISQVSSKMDCLVIVDNLESTKVSENLFDLLKYLNCALLVTSVKGISRNEYFQNIRIPSFSKEDSYNLAVSILGVPFAEVNRENIDEMANKLGYLPIAINILFRRILYKPLNFKLYIDQLNSQNIHLSSFEYDRKDLFSSFDLAFTSFTSEMRHFLTSLGIFAGHEFSLQAVAYANNMTVSDARILLQKAIDSAFIDKSSKGRFKLHPILRVYLKEKITSDIYYLRLTEYYIKFIKQLHKGDDINILTIIDEESNILGLMEYCFNKMLYTQFIELSERISTLLWLIGNWSILPTFNEKIQQAYKLTGNKAGLAYYYMEHLGRMYYFMNDFQNAFYYLKLAYEIALDLNNKYLIALAEQKYAIGHIEKLEYIEAEKLLLRTIKMFDRKRDLPDKLKSYIYLGRTWRVGKNNKKAFHYLQKAYMYSQKYQLLDTQGIALLYLGELSSDMGKQTKALKYLLLDLEIEKKLKRKVGLAMNARAIARVYIRMHNIESAKKAFRKAIEIFEDIHMHTAAKELQEEMTSY